MAGGKWNDDYLRHMCKLSSVTAHMICSEGFDPTDIGPEPKMNVVNMYRILAKTFIELQARAGMKPRFVKNPQHCEQHGGRDG